MNIFLTGHSSGFGKALALYCLNNNLRVFGLSRSELNNEKIIQEKCAFEKQIEVSDTPTMWNQ